MIFRRRCRGFTLIETVAALVVLSTVGVSLLALTNRLLESSNRLHNHQPGMGYAWNILMAELIADGSVERDLRSQELRSYFLDDQWQHQLSREITQSGMLVKRTVTANAVGGATRSVQLSIYTANP